MTAATLVLSRGRRLGRAELMHLGMALLIGMTSLAAAGSSLSAPAPAPAPPAPSKAAVAAAYGNLPIRFEANQGQTDPSVKFLVHSAGAQVFLTLQGAVWSLPAAASGTTASGTVVRMGLVGANPAPRVVGTGAVPGVSNYLIGKDPAKWHSGVPSFSGVRYQGVYPGIDQVYHAGGAGGMEYDFEVAPGADPSVIRLAFEGATPTVHNGDLVLSSEATEVLRQPKPVIYQGTGASRREVRGGFMLSGGQVGFGVGRYDHSRSLVIDPVIVYSTYLGGGGANRTEAINGIALDSSNDAFVTGMTPSTSFPTTVGAYKTTCGTTSVPCTLSLKDAFVSELNPSGSGLVYSTYLGGSGDDQGNGIAVDSSNDAYVVGTTGSADLPTTNGYQTTLHGTRDAFLAKLNPTGSGLLYGTYLGGTGGEQAKSVALGSAGVAFVAGTTFSTDFPTVNAYQSAAGGGGRDGFLAKIDTGQSGTASLLYSSYIGGTGGDDVNAVAVDSAAPSVAYLAGATTSTNFPTQNAYQAANAGGQDAFLTKLDTTLGTGGLLYSTYAGGSGDDEFNGMTVKSGVAYLVGSTSSTNYPTLSPYQATNAGGLDDVVVTDINTAGIGTASLLYSTYFGGDGTDIGNAIALDAAGQLTIVGTAGDCSTCNFPILNPMQGGSTGGFAAKLDPTAGTGGLRYSTIIGSFGTPNAVVIDSTAAADAYVGGYAFAGFPTTTGAFQTAFAGPTNSTDGFVMKIDPTPVPPVVTALSVASGPFTGGTQVIVTGSGFAGATAVTFGSVPAAGYTVNSSTQITTVSPCHAPSGGSCPESALDTVPNSTVNVRVTNPSNYTSTGLLSSQFLYGEGNFDSAKNCTQCESTNAGHAVALANGKVLRTVSGVDEYGDGVAVNGSSTFMSGTSSSHQASFKGSDVGKRLEAFVAPNSTPVFPRGTTIKSVSSANTVVVSNAATAGGINLAFDISNNDSEIYDPASNNWTPTGSCNACGADGGPNDAARATLTLLGSGKVLAVGGADPTALRIAFGLYAVPDAVLYDPGTGTWTPTTSLSTPRKGHTTTLLGNGNVLVAGGSDTGVPSDCTTLDSKSSAELYVPTTGTWLAAASMASPRAAASATLLSSGKVLVAGGAMAGTTSNCSPALASAELYDPVLGSWSGAGSMTSPRWGHTMTALPTSGTCGANCGKVLVAHGDPGYFAGGNQGPEMTAELYSPSGNSWALTGAPSVRAVNDDAPNAVLLPNGRVLVVQAHNPSERYDPVDGNWKSVGVSTVSDCCLVLLPAGPSTACKTSCGKVLVTDARFDHEMLYAARPVITSISPTNGLHIGGTTVTVTGTGLASVTQVNFGTVAGSNLSHDATNPDTKLTIKSPGGGIATTVDLTAISTGGVSAISSSDRFLYI